MLAIACYSASSTIGWADVLTMSRNGIFETMWHMMRMIDDMIKVRSRSSFAPSSSISGS